ncbi:MAG: PhoH family protein, partial [Lachnospiraceae bacterium]|nr:PhoH family protein [Lachnospiraceae bacterium]
MSIGEASVNIPAPHIKNVFGELDHNIKTIERTLSVTIITRGESVRILGDSEAVDKAARVLDQLVSLSVNGTVINDQNVNYTLSLCFEDKEREIGTIDKEIVAFTAAGKPVKPKTLGQRNYVDLIREKMI